MRLRYWVSALALTTLFVGGQSLSAAEKKKELVNFSTLESVSAETARARTLEWLKATGKADEQKFEAIWKQGDRTVLDRVADTLALGDAAAAKLLAEARNPQAPAPVEVPALLKDAKAAPFFRANLALAYAKALSNRRVHEEALDTLKAVTPEQVIDPASYLFHRAVCEHALVLKKEATGTINRLLEDALDAPERYKTVATLMLLDMQTWKDKKDLGAIVRKMKNSERRLELARGGPQTQKIQKEIVDRLDEIIKELENKKKGGGQCPNGGSCPGGSPGDGQGQQPGAGNNPTQPMPDSQIANNGGTGRTDAFKGKKVDEEGWAKLPPAERQRVLQELTRGMSARNREAIENYFNNLLRNQQAAAQRNKR